MPWSIWWGINRSYELHSTCMKANDFSGCLCHLVQCVYQRVIGTKFRLSVYVCLGRSMVSPRSSGEISSTVGEKRVGWGGHPHQAADPGRQPCSSASCHSPSLCLCPTQRKVEAEEEADKRSCKVGGFWSEGKLDDLLTKTHLYFEFQLEKIDQVTNVAWLCLSLVLNNVLLIFILVADIVGVICQRKLLKWKMKMTP